MFVSIDTDSFVIVLRCRNELCAVAMSISLLDERGQEGDRTRVETTRQIYTRLVLACVLFCGRLIIASVRSLNKCKQCFPSSHHFN